MRNQISQLVRSDELVAVELLFNLNDYDGINTILKLMARLALKSVVQQDLLKALPILRDIIYVLNEDIQGMDTQFLKQIAMIEKQLSTNLS